MIADGGRESKLYLFCSIDIVGSTALKNKKSERRGHHPWLNVFGDFYDNFPQKFVHACDKNRVEDKDLRVWKLLGDEILIYFHITDPKSPARIIKSMKETIKSYTETVFTGENASLNLKGTCWLAGTPVVNAAIPVASMQGGVNLDFLGPSIDIGFRIAKFANPNRIIISADLAYMLADVTDEEDYNLSGKIYFGGNHELKGVLHGKPYPLFWISMGHREDTELLDLSQEKPRNHRNILSYVRAYVESFGDQTVICLPYIRSGDRDIYGKIANEHADQLRFIIQDQPLLDSAPELPTAAGDGQTALEQVTGKAIDKK